MGMKNQKRIEKLILERWPKLRKLMQTTVDCQKLIAILDEIDELLAVLEVRIAAQGISEDCAIINTQRGASEFKNCKPC